MVGYLGTNAAALRLGRQGFLATRGVDDNVAAPDVAGAGAGVVDVTDVVVVAAGVVRAGTEVLFAEEGTGVVDGLEERGGAQVVPVACVAVDVVAAGAAAPPRDAREAQDIGIDGAIAPRAGACACACACAGACDVETGGAGGAG